MDNLPHEYNGGSYTEGAEYSHAEIQKINSIHDFLQTAAKACMENMTAHMSALAIKAPMTRMLTVDEIEEAAYSAIEDLFHDEIAACENELERFNDRTRLFKPEAATRMEAIRSQATAQIIANPKASYNQTVESLTLQSKSLRQIVNPATMPDKESIERNFRTAFSANGSVQHAGGQS